MEGYPYRWRRQIVLFRCHLPRCESLSSVDVPVRRALGVKGGALVIFREIEPVWVGDEDNDAAEGFAGLEFHVRVARAHDVWLDAFGFNISFPKGVGWVRHVGGLSSQEKIEA